MCGIAGVARLAGTLEANDLDDVEAMGISLVHRGPDSFRTWSDDVVALTHRRLAIIDLSEGGAQPKLSASGRFVLTFNGEIYNYKQLGDRLRSEGWINRTDSDSEVLLEVIERWGLAKFVDLADGQYAFALYDTVQRRVSLVRDRFGEKPLSYCVHNGRIYFASEVRAFERIRDLRLSMDLDAVGDFFRFNHIPGNATVFQQVRRVPPATIVEFDLRSSGPPTESTYWSPPEWQPHTAPRSPFDLDELVELVETSTRNRLVSDRPIGAFLSGGIDSSLTCALAARNVSGALKTFTMGWENVEYDESKQAQRVAAALGADHHHVRLSKGEVVRQARRLGVVMDEPFADPSLLAVQLVAASARQHVVVGLSGDGGDELFAGYNRHRWMLRISAAKHRLPLWARRQIASVARAGSPLLEIAMRPIAPTRRPRLVADKVAKFASAVSAASMTDSYQRLIAQNESVGQPRRLPTEVAAGLSSDDRDHFLWALRAADVTGYLCDDILTKVDRASMSVSLESRTPFLNKELAEYALRLGPRDLFGRNGGKQPLRAALAAVLPDVKFNQTKSGFGVPIADLLRGELLADLQDSISTAASRDLGVTYDWRGAVSKLTKGDDSPVAMLWSLLMFEYWYASRGAVSGRLN